LIGTLAGGVASNCGDQDFPGVYIRMDHPKILTWLLRHLNELSESGGDDPVG
jgi:hypothetical protein